MPESGDPMTPTLFDQWVDYVRPADEPAHNLICTNPQVMSRQAAESMADLAPTMRERVFKMIEMHQPVTDEMIGHGLGMNPSTVRPRRLELQRDGRIRASLIPLPTLSGRKAIAWEVVREPNHTL